MERNWIFRDTNRIIPQNRLVTNAKWISASFHFLNCVLLSCVDLCVAFGEWLIPPFSPCTKGRQFSPSKYPWKKKCKLWTTCFCSNTLYFPRLQKETEVVLWSAFCVLKILIQWQINEVTGTLSYTMNQMISIWRLHNKVFAIHVLECTAETDRSCWTMEFTVGPCEWAGFTYRN